MILTQMLFAPMTEKHFFHYIALDQYSFASEVLSV